MNRFAGRKKGSSKSGRAKQRKRSVREKWLSSLERNFGVYHQSNEQNLRQMVIVYNTSIPPRMPAPAGPTQGADFTMTQFVRGSDMTLPTGSALVGSLIRQGGISDVFASWAFCLADIPNVASVGALFDQYRIDEIHFRLRSRNPAVYIANIASPNNNFTAPLIVIDRDDNTAPTTLGELQQYDNCQQISAQDSIDVIFEPSITPSVFSAGAFSGYAVDDSGKYWLDVANTSIPHYGIKVGMPALASTASKYDWDVEAIYKVSFLNVR